MATKSRDPKNLSRDDLVTWSQDLCMFLVDHAGDPVPTDWDELDAVAQVCKTYWLSLNNPPEYAALATRMAAMVVAVDAFESKHTAYRAAIGDKQDAVNLRERRRADLLVCEREIFNWYHGAHPKGDDDWWRTGGPNGAKHCSSLCDLLIVNCA